MRVVCPLLRLLCLFVTSLMGLCIDGVVVFRIRIHGVEGCEAVFVARGLAAMICRGLFTCLMLLVLKWQALWR